MADAAKGLSTGFLVFIGLVFAAIGVAFKLVIMDDRAGEERGWMTAHAWLFLIVVGVAVLGYAIAKMVRK